MPNVAHLGVYPAGHLVDVQRRHAGREFANLNHGLLQIDCRAHSGTSACGNQWFSPAWTMI